MSCYESALGKGEFEGGTPLAPAATGWRPAGPCPLATQEPYGQVISAGVVEHGPEGFVCHGGNAELNVKARPEEDAAIITEALRVR